MITPYKTFLLHACPRAKEYLVHDGYAQEISEEVAACPLCNSKAPDLLILAYKLGVIGEKRWP